MSEAENDPNLVYARMAVTEDNISIEALEPLAAMPGSRSLPERLRLTAYAPRREVEKIHNEAANEIERLWKTLESVIEATQRCDDAWDMLVAVENIAHDAIHSENTKDQEPR